MFTKQVVLVAGFDYEFTGVDFAAMAVRRLNFLSKKRPRDQLKFTLFDVRAGTVKINELDSRGRKRTWTEATTMDTTAVPPAAVPLHFNAVSAANYDMTSPNKEKPFRTNPAGVMSILDVYDFVQKIGAGGDAHTLTELSFFGHGWAGGPILVNSFDTGDPNDPSIPRDPNDKDARLRKDFVAPAMDATKLTNFKNAFEVGAAIWVWGCSFAKAYLKIINAFFRKKPKDKPLRRLRDSDLFRLEFNEDLTETDGRDRFEEVMGLLPGGTLTVRRIRSYAVTKSLADLRTLFKDHLRDRTYSGVATRATGVNVIGALLGTSADYEIGGTRLMLIPRNKEVFGDDFTGVISFYKTIVGVTMDSEDRGYAIFSP